ncbi:hypothetical protein JOM56_000852 [Amanita muscaria]
MSRISKRDENVKKLGTSSQNSSPSDAAPSPHAIINNHNGDDLKCSLSAPNVELERVIHELNVDTKDLASSEHAQLGDDPSSEHGPKQSPVRSGDQDPCLTAADPGVAHESSITDETGPRSPLFSPLFSPVDLHQRRPDVTVKPQASSTPILLVPSRARGGAQVTENSVPRPPQSSIPDDTSSPTAVAGPTARQSRPASVQGLLPVCALDVDFLSAKPRAASAPILAPFDSSSPQTQHASSTHEFKQNPTSSSESSDRQKWKPTGCAVSKDRSPSFTAYVGLSGNVLDPSSADPGSSTNRMSNGRSKQTLAEVGIPVTPGHLLESSAPNPISATHRFLAEMSEEEKRNLAKIIDNCIQKTGLFSSPKDLIARSRMHKRKRKDMEATTSTISPDAIPDQSSTSTTPLTDNQGAPAPKPKRKRTSKPKKDRPIVANPYPTNPYPRTTTTPPDGVPQQDYPFDAQQVQGIRTDIPSQMPLINPASMAPRNVSQSTGGLDPVPNASPPTIHGNDFTMNTPVAPTHAAAFEHAQSTAPGSAPYSLNLPRNLGINHPQGMIPGVAHPTGPAYNPAFMNSQRFFWQRAQIARQMQVRRQAEFNGGPYHAPFIPNAMSMAIAREGGWSPQRPDLPSQPLAAAGLPHFIDAAQAASGQTRIQPSNMYPQYQVPSFDHNIQSGPYHMQHPLFNQTLDGPSHPLLNPPAFNAQLMPPTRYESPFPPIHFGRERQREVDYVTGPSAPAVQAPMQYYPHGLDPSFGNHAVAPINLHDDLTMRGQISVATASRMRPTLPGSLIGDEPTNATR